MKRIAILLLFSIPAPAAHGQEAPRPIGLSTGNERAMYEDIEIMRQLLARRVAGRHTWSMECAVCHVVDVNFSRTSAMSGFRETADPHRNLPQGAVLSDFDADGWVDMYVAGMNGGPHGAVPLMIEGSHLAGLGVVFSMNLPAEARADLALTPPASEPKRASEWDRVRGQLHGEKTQVSEPAKRDTLTDALLHLLAENGKNFTRLSVNESVTIAVTFRNDLSGRTNYLFSAGNVHAQNSVNDTRLLRPSLPVGSTMRGSNASGGSSSGGMGGPAVTSGSTSSEAMNPERELELLAELHLKRNNFAEAASTYERVIANLRELKVNPNLPMNQVKAMLDQTNARLRDLSGKLAEVYIKLGKFEAAKKALSENSVSVAADSSSSMTKAAPEMKLPSKLILTASKRDLDRVGSGEIPFSEFQKSVSIQILDFETPWQPPPHK